MSESPESRLLTALELTDLGARMRAERFRREHPDASEDEVEACLQAWFLERRGAVDGDGVGRKVTLPRNS